MIPLCDSQAKFHVHELYVEPMILAWKVNAWTYSSISRSHLLLTEKASRFNFAHKVACRECSYNVALGPSLTHKSLQPPNIRKSWANARLLPVPDFWWSPAIFLQTINVCPALVVPVIPQALYYGLVAPDAERDARHEVLLW